MLIFRFHVNIKTCLLRNVWTPDAVTCSGADHQPSSSGPLWPQLCSHLGRSSRSAHLSPPGLLVKGPETVCGLHLRHHHWTVRSRRWHFILGSNTDQRITTFSLAAASLIFYYMNENVNLINVDECVMDECICCYWLCLYAADLFKKDSTLWQWRQLYF